MNESTDAHARATEISGRIRELLTDTIVHIDELATVVDELVALDGRRRAALSQIGVFHEHGPSVSEALVEIVHGHLGALLPNLPFVTRESANRAAEALLVRLDGGQVVGAQSHLASNATQSRL